jgi:hypothetical protein
VLVTEKENGEDGSSEAMVTIPDRDAAVLEPGVNETTNTSVPAAAMVAPGWVVTVNSLESVIK